MFEEEKDRAIVTLRRVFRDIITEDMKRLWKMMFNSDEIFDVIFTLEDDLMLVENTKKNLEVIIAILMAIIKGTTFEEGLGAFRKYHKELYERKRLEYESGTQTNLSIISKELNMSPKVVAFILAMKHYSSLVLKDEWTEDFIYEKMGDLYNYMHLIDRLIRDEINEKERLMEKKLGVGES